MAKRQITIMLTCPCNCDPLIPHFYIVKLGFTGVYIIFLFFLLNIDCGYALEPPHNLCSEQKFEIVKKNQLKIVIFTAVKNCYMSHGRVFVMRLDQLHFL